jgi:transcriptional regulator with XRE-family HTH domain
MHTAAQQELVGALMAMRKRAGMSQRELAAALGREQSYIGRIETGQRRVDIIELVEICRACGTNPNLEINKLIKRIADSIPARRPRA